MRYRQITWVERYRIGGLVAVGECPAAIARHVGRHRSTILRELRRNGGPAGSYQPETAQEQAARRRRAASRRSHFSPAEWRLVRGLLERQWSPAQVAGHLHRTGQVAISHETIYRYIWADKFAGGALYRHLRGRQRPRLKRGRYHDPRGRMPRKRLLRDRPAIVAARCRVGDWEIDTVLGHGSPDCVVTLVERKTGYLLLGKLPARTSAALNQRVRQLLRRSSRPVRTITADHGSELDGYPALEAATGARFYFAPPYSAIFSVVNGVLLEPLAYDHPDEVVSVGAVAPGLAMTESRLPLSEGFYFTFRDDNRTLADRGLLSRARSRSAASPPRSGSPPSP